MDPHRHFFLILHLFLFLHSSSSSFFFILLLFFFSFSLFFLAPTSFFAYFHFLPAPPLVFPVLPFCVGSAISLEYAWTGSWKVVAEGGNFLASWTRRSFIRNFQRVSTCPEQTGWIIPLSHSAFCCSLVLKFWVLHVSKTLFFALGFGVIWSMQRSVDLLFAICCLHSSSTTHTLLFPTPTHTTT